ncbi:MAG: hypothetical protein AAGI52_16680 [Bacteroidota bacterium]
MTRLLPLALLLVALTAHAQLVDGTPTTADSVAGQADRVIVDSFDETLASVPRGSFAPMPAPLAGVVWTAPEVAAEAVEDLARMRRAGVRAVRTGLVSDSVLAAADCLGIAVAQELPIADVHASELAARLPEADSLLSAALDRARSHSSARLFILARGVDTSDRDVRPFFERLAEIVRHRGAPGTRTAYLTRFVDDDRVSGTVDLVLLDARGRDPFGLLRRWRDRHETPVGLGAWGEGVVPEREGGWRQSGTEARQARVIERTLDAFLTADAPPEVAFLARWRDREERGVRAEVADLRYGLVAAGGTPRPALDVTAGVFTGRQRVFAFDAGPPESGPRSGLLVVIGWTLVLSLGALITLSPRMSGLVPQYFGRRDLYREAIQKGYGLSTVVTVSLAAILALTVGLVGATVLRAFAATDALTVAAAGWEPEAQRRMVRLVGSPALLGALIAMLYSAWVMLNVVWVGLIAGRRRRLRPVQALSIVVWPRWPWLLLLLGAMLVASLSPGTANVWAAVLLVVALGVETIAAWRSFVDLTYVGYVPQGKAFGIGFGVPFLLFLIGAVALLVTAGGEVGFLWHLAVRS